jgi:hypothetical protein
MNIFVIVKFIFRWYIASKILSNSYKMAVVVVQSVPISTKVVSSNPAPDEMNLMQPLYVIKFFSDLRQVGGFLWVLRFPPPIKLTATI